MADPNATSGRGIRNSSRRDFLRTAPAAAAASLALADAFALPAVAAAQNPTANFKRISAEEMQKDIAQTESNSGSITLVEEKGGLDFSMVLSSEKAKIAPEFEMHQHRDHVFQILEGSTNYEVGGKPNGGRMIGPGEWRGPKVDGATRITLNKGDRLIIRRGTPHKRSTPGQVTFTLISPGEPEKTT